MFWLKVAVVGAVFSVLSGCAFTPADPKTYNGQYMQTFTSAGQFQLQFNHRNESACASLVKLISTFDIFGRMKSFCTKGSNPNTTHRSSTLSQKGEEMTMEFIGLDDCNKYTADASKNDMKVVEFCQKK